MSNKYQSPLLLSASKGIYQRTRYPDQVTFVRLNNALQDLDLLAASITFSIKVPYKDRIYKEDFNWHLLSRFICNGNDNYISLTFNKPTSIKQLRVLYLKDIIKQLSMFPSLKDRVLSNLLNK